MELVHSASPNDQDQDQDRCRRRWEAMFKSALLLLELEGGGGRGEGAFGGSGGLYVVGRDDAARDEATGFNSEYERSRRTEACRSGEAAKQEQEVNCSSTSRASRVVDDRRLVSTGATSWVHTLHHTQPVQLGRCLKKVRSQIEDGTSSSAAVSSTCPENLPYARSRRKQPPAEARPNCLILGKPSASLDRALVGIAPYAPKWAKEAAGSAANHGQEAADVGVWPRRRDELPHPSGER